MKTNWRPSGIACLVLAALAWSVGTVAAAPGPAVPVVQVDASTINHACRLEVKADAAFEYTTQRPSQSLFIVELPGVAPNASEMAQVLDSEVVSSYRVLQLRAGDEAAVRLEILLREPAEPKLERPNPQSLVLTFAAPGAKAVGTTKPATPRARPAANPSPTVTASPADANSESEIDQITLDRSGEQTQVHVIGKGRLTYQLLRLENPDRLVLDFSHTRLAVTQRTVPGNVPPVRAVRMGQFQAGTARIVIHLESRAPYHVRAEGDSVIVSFDSVDAAGKNAQEKSAKSKPAHPAAVPLPVQSQLSHTHITQISFPANLTEPGAGLASPLPAERAKSDPPAQTPANTMNQPPAAAAASAPADPPPTPEALRNEASATANPKPAPAAAPAPAAIPAVNPAQDQAPGQTQKKFSGEPISVNLKDVDLKDFFRLVHEISGLNVVVDPNVKGTLTIVLDDVPWDQALDIVLRNNGLDQQLEGNVLRIATKETLKKEAEENRDLAKAQAEAADVVTTTRVLSYAKADSVKDTLKRFLSSRGDILADPRSNTLIIRDIPSVLPVLDNLIRQLDRKSQQVEIEARVVVATRSFARDIGTQFGFAVAGATDNFRNVFGGAPSVGQSPFIRNAPVPPEPLPVAPPLVSATGSSTISIPGTFGSPIPLNTNLGATVPTSGISFAHTEPNLALDFILTAAETKGVGRLLSKPKVITQNNEKATVKQGTKIPVQTIINNTISVQFIDAVLQLDVTPQITAEGTVFMDVKVENTQIDPAIPRIDGIPALDTQSAETKVLIADGGTVVIGGIIVTSQRTDISQVPLFGSLPVIGHLFKHTSVNTTAQELLFFLTPRILPT